MGFLKSLIKFSRFVGRGSLGRTGSAVQNAGRGVGLRPSQAIQHEGSTLSHGVPYTSLVFPLGTIEAARKSGYEESKRFICFCSSNEPTKLIGFPPA
jgi:hypothetical protein